MGKGGSSTSYQAQDPEAARRMAGVAEKADTREQDQYDLYKSDFEPLDKQLVQANVDVLPDQVAYSKASMQSQLGVLPYRTEAEKAALQESTRDIEQGQANKDRERAEQLKEFDLSDPAVAKFYDEATNGVNVGERMDQAGEEASQAYDNTMQDMTTKLSGMGINPNSGAFADNLRQSEFAKAGAVTGARTAARINAEGENFSRLSSAINARGRASGLSGTTDMASGGLGATPYASGTSNFGGYSLTNPVSRSQGYLGTEMSADNAGMQPAKTTTTTNDGGSGLGSMIGMLGAAAITKI